MNIYAVSLAMHGLGAQVRNEFYKFHLQPLHVSTLTVHPHKVPYTCDATRKFLSIIRTRGERMEIEWAKDVSDNE
jgi:hypothetical protein